MNNHKCTCGCVPPHSTALDCGKNREATRIYLQAMNRAGASGADKAVFLRDAVLSDGCAEYAGVMYRVLVGTQYDSRIVAVVRDGSAHDAAADYFVWPHDPEYARVAAVAAHV